jgi:hypothetical protein
MERVEDAAEIALGFANAQGRLGWGMVWKMRLDLTVGTQPL